MAKEAQPNPLVDYIVQMRILSTPDEEIRQELSKVEWPTETIEEAFKEADKTRPAINQPEGPDIFTKPTIAKKTENYLEPKKMNNGFSWWSFICLFTWWIPFIGLGISMHALDDIRKNHKSGTILAALGLILSIATIVFVLYIVGQLLMLNPDQYTGLSKFITDKFGLL